MSNDLLIVGSGLEAKLALSRFRQIEFGGKLLHLPAPAGPGTEVVSGNALPEQGAPAPARARLCDVWGKTVLSFKLPPMRLVDPSHLPSPVDSLASGLRVQRTQPAEQGVLVSLSDGSEMLCGTVLFCDGYDSQCHAFWTKPVPPRKDPHAVRCWAFRANNLIGVEDWEFRWAAGKSVELLPLPGGDIRACLRFKSRYGGKLSVPELRDLFSEFGADMTALLESLEEESLEAREERDLERFVFAPAPGSLALGRAAWTNRPMPCFDFLTRFCQRQLNILAEQLRVGPPNGPSFEAQSRESVTDLLEGESFCRRHLHADNAMLKPFRDLLLKLVPNSILAARIRKRIFN